MRSRTIACSWLVSALVAVLARPLAAQQTDTLPFRSGQWGAEFTAANFGGVGLLRFSNPRRAWLMDVQGRVTRQSGSTNQLSEFEIVTDSDMIQLRLGRRGYKRLAPRVVRYVGGGLLTRYTSIDRSPGAFAISAPVSFTQSQLDVSVGLFAEVGAQWMIAPNLGLGAAWSADAQAIWSEIERFSAMNSSAPTRSKTTVNTWSASLGSLAIRGTVFF